MLKTPNALNALSRSGYVVDLTVFTAGVLLVLAFAPFYLFPLAVLSPAWLFLAWLQPATPGRAAWRGFLFGLGLFGAGVSWVYVSIHTFGHMSVPLAVLTVLIFVALLSLYPALLGWLQARFFPGTAWQRLLLVMPALWVLFEWWRGWFLSGFPWLNLGYSQTPTPLFQLAPWIGVYGVSYFTAVTAGLTAWLLTDPKRNWAVAFAIAASLWVIPVIASSVNWTHPVGAPLKTALVQGNISLAKKWDPGYRPYILQHYLSLSEQTDAQIVVWPEAAIPMYLKHVDPAFMQRLRQVARSERRVFVIGAIEQEQNGDDYHYYNSAVVIGKKTSIYRKRHLVPFGEFVPLRFLFGWLVESVNIPMSDFSVGSPDQRPIAVAGQRLGIFICYEDAFGQDVIQMLPAASLLVNISEDAWFGRSLASSQRLQMARMRAKESGRSMIRAANTGITAVIDHRGRVVARSPQFQQHVLVAQVQPRQGATPYVLTGNRPLIAALFLLSLAPFVGRLWRQAPRQPPPG